MQNHLVIAGPLAVALAWGGISAALSASEQNDARRLFRALSQYAYLYDDIRSAEARAARTALDLNARPDQTAKDLRELEGRLLDLSDRLTEIDVRGAVRGQILAPIISGLRDDRADLVSTREIVAREGLGPAVRDRLEKHIHPPDLIHPALNAIAARFGFRQRLWRGHPLTI